MIADGQGFPQLNAPISDPQSGRITPPWYQLIIALWNRTGAGQNLVGQGVFSGEVRTFAGPIAKIPSGWLACDGRPVSRKTYSALFAAIGTTWGVGDGSTTFNLPDARNQFIIGAGSTHALGQSGGSANVTLSVANLASHNHGVTDPGHTHTFTGTPHSHTITDPGHTHTDGTPNATKDVAAGTDKTSAIAGNTGNSTTGITGTNAATAGGTNASSTTGVTTQNAGTGTPFSVLPPFVAMNAIIKT